jgi:hypothetical protein
MGRAAWLMREGAAGPSRDSPRVPARPICSIHLIPTSMDGGSQYVDLALGMPSSYPNFSVMTGQQYKGFLFRAGLDEQGCFSNPSVDADEGMAWQGTTLRAGACLGCLLLPRVKVLAPKSPGVVGHVLCFCYPACIRQFAVLSGPDPLYQKVSGA